MDIVTDRLRLRTLQKSDSMWIAREIANPKVHQWLTAPPNPYTKDMADDFIQRNHDNSGYRVVCCNDQPLGIVSLNEEKFDVPDLGYWLAESAWGLGFMTEAVSALLAWHFNSRSTDVRSGWIPGNAASRNVLMKMGFVADGSVQALSGFHDKIVTVDKVRLTFPTWQHLRAQA